MFEDCEFNGKCLPIGAHVVGQSPPRDNGQLKELNVYKRNAY
jgi:hypothetical protein